MPWLIPLTAFLVSLGLIPLLKPWAIRHGLCDDPRGDELKIHRDPVPYVGGIALLFAVVLGSLLGATIETIPMETLLGVWGALTVGFGLGVWDDLSWTNTDTYQPSVKFIAQVTVSALAAVLLYAVGIRIETFPIAVVMLPLAAFYAFGGINALNMQDGLDGLAGGLSAISALGFVVLGSQTGDAVGLVLGLAVLGAVIGFLVHNAPPASVFMGDGGSHFLGVALISLAIGFTSEPYDPARFVGPILVLGLPVFDAAFTVGRRAYGRKPLFEGDRGHLYDRLMDRGWSARATVGVCCLIQAGFAAAGVALYLL